LGVMVFKAPCNNISVISWQGKPEYPEKTTNLLQVTDKLYHIIQLVTIKNVIRTNSMVNHWRLQKGKFEDTKGIQKPNSKED